MTAAECRVFTKGAVRGGVLFIGLSSLCYPQKEAQPWQVRGIEAALHDPLQSVRAEALERLNTFSMARGIGAPEIAEYLKAPDRDVRCYAAEVLGVMQARDQAPELAKLLKDPDSDVRRSAAQALGNMQATDQAPELFKLMKEPDRDINVFYSAADALGAMRAKDQAPGLAKLLKAAKGYIRSSAAKALGVMQARDQAPELAQLLKDPDNDVRSSAAKALGDMQARDQAPELAKLLKDPDKYVRSSAAQALGDMQARDQAPELAKLLKDPDYDVGSSAAKALGDMQARDQAPELVKMLKNPNVYGVRGSAAYALGVMQATDQVPELVKLLNDPDNSVRGSAAYALGVMQARDQVPELVKLLNDPDNGVRGSATKALGVMQAMDQVPELVKLVKLLKDPEDDLFAAEAVSVIRASDQVPELVKLLKNPDHSLRYFAAKALGVMQARDQVPELAKLLKDPDKYVRSSAAEALGVMQSRDQAPELAKLLKDPENSVRISAAEALGVMQARDQIPKLVELAKDPENNARISAAEALGKMHAWDQAPEAFKLLREYPDDALDGMGPLPLRMLLADFSESYYSDHAQQGRIRFMFYYLTGGDAKVQLLIHRIMFGTGQEPVRVLSVETARETLRVFDEVMPAKSDGSEFSNDAERQILQLTEDWKGHWSPSGDHALFSSLGAKMSRNSAITLQGIIEIPWWQTAFERLWKIVAVQVVFWIMLLYFYPTSPQVQAFFIWNRWARKFLGLGYVDVCLTWIPFWRNRLLAPFREELTADARTGDDRLDEYFEDVEVQDVQDTEPMVPVRLDIAVAEVRGQIILEGESGLGKSMFLRRLVKNSKLPIVYLPADSCDIGPFAAINRKLQGKAGDQSFLKSTIYCGGLGIVIDGLNEVTVETRERIRRFLEDFPKAHVLLATQPLLWKRPPKARVLRLMKLSDDRILRFLESRYSSFRQPSPMIETEYKTKCKAYLNEVLGETQSAEDRSAAQLVLSNPMDLTTAARILVNGDRPTLTNLQEQQYRYMKREFDDTHPGEEFPLKQLAESIYERRLRDELALDGHQFIEAIHVMVAHKLALEQHEKNADGKPTVKWVLRHDKIRDYFLIQAFLADEDARIPGHIDDPRFRGVYVMLASLLPLEQAKDLMDSLVDRAAETKDYYLSDEVVQILKSRKKRPDYQYS